MNTLTSNKPLKIGEVADQSGLSVKTIRYYDDVGLLSPAVSRSRSGYRLFSQTVLSRLEFVKRAQSLGLSLSEIRDILEIRDRGQLPCDAVKQQLMAKVYHITRQIETLETLKAELQEILAHWQDPPSPKPVAHNICPNLQTHP